MFQTTATPRPSVGLKPTMPLSAHPAPTRPALKPTDRALKSSLPRIVDPDVMDSEPFLALSEAPVSTPVSAPAPAPAPIKASTAQARQAAGASRFAQRPSGGATATRGDSSGSLIIGPGILLSGEIGPCEHIDVQGSLQANVQNCHEFCVSKGGQFRGSANSAEATIDGNVEGDLVVQGLLKITSTGVVSGRVRFGEVEIERGGRITGDISVHEG